MTALLALLACTPPPEPCTSAVRHVYDPEAPEITAWPDDAFTVEASDSPTGRRVAVSGSAWAGALDGLIGSLPAQLDGASGFATLGEVVLRFSDPVDPPPSVEASIERGLQILDLSTSPATPVPFVGRSLDGGRQLMLQPARPLRQGAPHAVLATTAFRAGGRCIAPAPAVTADLEAGAHDDLLGPLDLHPNEVSALVRFTTHDDQSTVVAAGEVARSAPQAWAVAPDCVVETGFTRCETAFEPLDFRDPAGGMASTASGHHRVPVTVWLPESPAQGVVMVGHGLGSSRNTGDARRAAERIVARGLAVVAVDALQHGEHPTATFEGASSALPFLGLDLASASFDGQVMRENFDQSVLERVQLLSLVAQAPDIDGDGIDDLNPSRLGYLGISLGGLMGNGVMALSPDVEMGVLPIAGGNLASIIRGTEVMAGVLPLLADLAGSDTALERYLSVTQSIVDPADPALWARHVLEDRYVGASVPDVLLPVAMQDEVVPPPAGQALARAMDLPHIAPVVEAVPGLSSGGSAPVAANHPSGATVGYFQYGTVTSGGEVETAIHGNLPNSDEAVEQIYGFVESWLEGQAEIVNPYGG
ncbi:MAG: hypothetical protein H6737_14550 [Alphaproteobacteria bacterium]|nr:hypothetical protein [Alphaproteobacteria bacterium]